MWMREELKLKAKKVLAKNYCKLLGVWLLFIFIFLCFLYICDRTNFFDMFVVFNFNDLGVKIFCGCYGVISPIYVGVTKYTMNTIYNKQNIKDVIMVFDNKNYVNVVITNLLRYVNIVVTNLLCYVYIFLWSILFIVPGIVKLCEYSMVPYILAESPYINPNDAIKWSREITMGHKMKIFILCLSFFGWFLLGIIFFGGVGIVLGIVFVVPYFKVTFAELYFTLKEDAVEKGFIYSYI